jgi:hypothetical protein
MIGAIRGTTADAVLQHVPASQRSKAHSPCIQRTGTRYRPELEGW